MRVKVSAICFAIYFRGRNGNIMAWITAKMDLRWVFVSIIWFLIR